MTEPHRFASPEECETAFYEAFAAGDLDRLMAVWVPDDTIICIHPGSVRLVGQAEVREAWRQILAGNNRLRFRIIGRESVQQPHLAVHSVYERIAVEGQTGEEPTPLAATNVYRLTDDGWRLWLHHASPVGEADDEAAEDSPPPTLH